MRPIERRAAKMAAAVVAANAAHLDAINTATAREADAENTAALAASAARFHLDAVAEAAAAGERARVAGEGAAYASHAAHVARIEANRALRWTQRTNRSVERARRAEQRWAQPWRRVFAPAAAVFVGVTIVAALAIVIGTGIAESGHKSDPTPAVRVTNSIAEAPDIEAVAPVSRQNSSAGASSAVRQRTEFLAAQESGRVAFYEKVNADREEQLAAEQFQQAMREAGAYYPATARGYGWLPPGFNNTRVSAENAQREREARLAADREFAANRRQSSTTAPNSTATLTPELAAQIIAAIDSCIREANQNVKTLGPERLDYIYDCEMREIGRETLKLWCEERYVMQGLNVRGTFRDDGLRWYCDA